jgi:hypothetical protein
LRHESSRGVHDQQHRRAREESCHEDVDPVFHQLQEALQGDGSSLFELHRKRSVESRRLTVMSRLRGGATDPAAPLSLHHEAPGPRGPGIQERWWPSAPLLTHRWRQRPIRPAFLEPAGQRPRPSPARRSAPCRGGTPWPWIPRAIRGSETLSRLAFQPLVRPALGR